MTTAMDVTFAKQADGIRLSFPVVRGNGTLRTGLASGDFTLTCTNPGDSSTSTPSVSELASKSGHYTALIPAAFLTTNGVGTYHWTVEVDTFSGPSGSPNVRVSFGGLAVITAQDIDSVGGGSQDWTAAEREQIRFRLAMDGTQTDPTTGAGTIEDILADTASLDNVKITTARANNLDEITSTRLAELDAANLPADIALILTTGSTGPWTTATGFAVPGSAMTLTAGERTAIENEILDADKSLHVTANTIGQQIQNTLQVVHFDGDAGAGGAGTLDDPIGGGNPPTALVTRMDAIGAKVAYLKFEGDFIRPTAGDWTKRIFIGAHGSYVGFDPNDRDFNASFLKRLSIQSSGLLGFGAFAAGFGGISGEDCFLLGPLAMRSSTWVRCHFAFNSANPMRLNSGQYQFTQCYNDRPDSLGQPVVAQFLPQANINVVFDDFGGSVIVRNMTLATHHLEFHGREYDLVVEATCTAGDIRLRGGGIISVVAGATVTIEDQRFISGESINIGPILLDNDDIEVTAILSRHGRIVTDATSATITINDNTGALVYTQTIATPPNAGNGGYAFSGTPILAIVQGTYTAVISITDPLSTVASQVEVIGAP